jgi:hypothetical protein
VVIDIGYRHREAAIIDGANWPSRLEEERMIIVARTRQLLGRPLLPLLAALTVLLAACSSVGTSSFTFWDAIFSMIAFFFWFMFIWIFIGLFGDIFRRNDLSGGAKAGWLLVLVVLPFLGALIYIAMRPKVTAQDVEMMARVEAGQKAAASVSVADQIAKLQELRTAGVIDDAEFEALKQKAMSSS